MNLALCLWVWARACIRGDHVEIMVHEPFLAFREGTWKQDAAAVIHRVMTAILLRAARAVWVSTPKWAAAWKPYAFGRRIPFQWLPLPSNVPVIHDPLGIAAIHERYASNGILIGHFGSFGAPITGLLSDMLPPLMTKNPNVSVLLIGGGGENFRKEIIRMYPDIGGRLSAVGHLDASDLSRHISACDLMIQPYPDGVTSRRTTVMAALSHGRATITTSGPLTEAFWSESEAVALHEVGDLSGLLELVCRLKQDSIESKRFGERARALYEERFEMRRIIGTLQGAERASCMIPNARLRRDVKRA